MNRQVVIFLAFKGKNIVYLTVNGTYWIAIKPVCEALHVDYIRQYKNLKKDPLPVSALSKQTIQIPGDDRFREFVCLPEEYIYGWIFSSRKLECALSQNKDCIELGKLRAHEARIGRKLKTVERSQMPKELDLFSQMPK